ncbi:MAG TPA: DUF2490 domain-containing protein [Pyrinomonadaceae bacterium]
MVNVVVRSILFVSFVLFATKVVGQPASPPETDIQQWNDVQIAVPVTKDIDFNLLGTLRIGRDISRAVDERIGVGFTVRAGKYLSFTPSYLHIGMQPFEGRKLWESRLSFATTLRFQTGKFRLSDRNLFERRYRHPGIPSTRYRNRFQVEHPIGRDTIKLSLFASDEVFYDWSVDRWVRNRFAAGVSKVLNSNLTLDVYYLRQNDGISRPGDLHVIGTTWRIRL